MEDFDIFEESSFSLLDKPHGEDGKPVDAVYDSFASGNEVDFYTGTSAGSETSLDYETQDFDIGNPLETETQMTLLDAEIPPNIDDKDIFESGEVSGDTQILSDIQDRPLLDVDTKFLSNISPEAPSTTSCHGPQFNPYFVNEQQTQLGIFYYPGNAIEVMDYRAPIRWYIDNIEDRFPRFYDYFFRIFHAPLGLNAEIRILPVVGDDSSSEGENPSDYTERIMTWIRNRVVWSGTRPVFNEAQLILYCSIFFLVKAEFYEAFSSHTTCQVDPLLSDAINRALYPYSLEMLVETFGITLHQYSANTGYSPQDDFSLLDNHILEHITPSCPSSPGPMIAARSSTSTSGNSTAPQMQSPSHEYSSNPSKRRKSDPGQSGNTVQFGDMRFQKKQTVAEYREQKRNSKRKSGENERGKNSELIWKRNLRPAWKLEGGNIPMNVPPAACAANMQQTSCADPPSSKKANKRILPRKMGTPNSKFEGALPASASMPVPNFFSINPHHLKEEQSHRSLLRRARFSMLVDRVTKMKDLGNPVQDPVRSAESEAPVFKGINNNSNAAKLPSHNHMFDTGFTKKLCDEIRKNIGRSEIISDPKRHKALCQASRALRRGKYRDLTCTNNERPDKVDVLALLGIEGE